MEPTVAASWAELAKSVGPVAALAIIGLYLVFKRLNASEDYIRTTLVSISEKSTIAATEHTAVSRQLIETIKDRPCLIKEEK